MQAALSAMNLHLQRHGKDLVEIVRRAAGVGRRRQADGRSAGAGRDPRQLDVLDHRLDVGRGVAPAAARRGARPEQPGGVGARLERRHRVVAGVDRRALQARRQQDAAAREGQGQRLLRDRSSPAGRRSRGWSRSSTPPSSRRPARATRSTSRRWSRSCSTRWWKKGGERGPVRRRHRRAAGAARPHARARAGGNAARRRPARPRPGMQTVRLAILQLPPDGKGALEPDALEAAGDRRRAGGAARASASAAAHLGHRPSGRRAGGARAVRRHDRRPIEGRARAAADARRAEGRPGRSGAAHLGRRSAAAAAHLGRRSSADVLTSADHAGPCARDSSCSRSRCCCRRRPRMR